MKKIRNLLLLIAASCVLLSVPVTASAAGSSVQAAKALKQGLKKEGSKYCYYVNGKKACNTWKTVNGRKYYFNSKGYAVVYSAKISGKIYVFQLNGQLVKPAKNSIVQVGKYSYYVNKNGQASTGWLLINKKLYYADSLGRFYKNKTYQGVTFTNTGAAKSNTASKLKIKTMGIVSSITKSGMTKSQKLKACWNYMVNTSRFRYWPYYPNLNKKGWHKETALNILTNYRGNCYGFACGFAALASEVGYNPYVICGRVDGSRDQAADGMTRHCWVKIDGRYYDPEAQVRREVA
ncbi:MAG: transglutaminase domain-containing protein [Eubacteriales bacterium]|nr:transglutaminase domain-containing protein [Eubacteriales bacterium]